MIDSKHSDYKVGDLVFGFVGWQSHCLVAPTQDERFRVIPDILPLPTMLNVLGLKHLTLWVVGECLE